MDKNPSAETKKALLPSGGKSYKKPEITQKETLLPIFQRCFGWS